jgi:NADPH:quinone reductase-like Zn-dependent oxidoreductase
MGAESGGGVGMMVSQIVEAFMYRDWRTVGPSKEPRRWKEKLRKLVLYKRFFGTSGTNRNW